MQAGGREVKYPKKIAGVIELWLGPYRKSGMRSSKNGHSKMDSGSGVVGSGSSITGEFAFYSTGWKKPPFDSNLGCSTILHG